MATNTTITPAQSAFEHHFKAMVPLILSEWPQLIEENLLATEGDLDLAVAYISDETDHTQTLTRHHLDELATLIAPASTKAKAPAKSPDAASPDAASPDAASPDEEEAFRADTVLADSVPTRVGTFLEETIPSAVSTILEETVPSSVDQLLNELESRAEHLIAELKADMLPELEKKARGNLGTSLLIALGLGFVLGLLVGGKRD
ncbi:hypothetical protein [Nodosilinea nodulosa]|uniref:hypothetical protein n=1 Tax=Nodosilinea nodulosa TaxID=416001 RepID=UPI0002E52FF8|nr:hypothetical protein [Nodosilinea nodulosa]